MAFKMKSGSTGPMYKNYGVGEPLKKYGHSSDDAPAKQKASKVMKKNEKKNAVIDDYNKAAKDFKTFIADNTTGEVGDSTSFTPASVEAMQQFEKMQKDLDKKAKKAKKAAGVKMTAPTKQKASKTMKKNQKKNERIDAYNKSIADMKKFIADNTTGEVGDSTSFTSSSIEAMQEFERLQKESKKLAKKIK